MRRINSPAFVSALVFVVISGVARAELSDPTPRTSNTPAQHALQQDGILLVAEAEKQTEPAPSEEVQERAVPIAPLGGTVAPPPTQVNPAGFGCSATTHTCSCHGSASSIDCTMARRLVCGGEFYACPTTADPARLCCKAVK